MPDGHILARMTEAESITTAAELRAMPDKEVASIWLGSGPEPSELQLLALAECERRGIDF